MTSISPRSNNDEILSNLDNVDKLIDISSGPISRTSSIEGSITNTTIAPLNSSLEGSLVSPRDENDLIYENKAYGGSVDKMYFPEECDLRHRTRRTARDQANRGTCAAHVGATISENKLFPIENYMSPEFIYHHRMLKPQKGMYGRDVFHILKTIGSVPENLYPYDDDNSPIPDARLYEIANEYRIHNYARVETIIGLKMALLGNEVTYLLLPAYNKSEKFWRAPSKDAVPIYHAVAVVGYNKKGFIFKNSWGDRWGNNGYGLFPYKKWKLHTECWVSIS